MRKTPTVFQRNPDDMRSILTEANPDAAWVLDGTGYATRKYDGTCVMVDNAGTWYARREVKQGKPFPDGFLLVDHDPVTGKHVGWEPAEASGFAKHLSAAIDAADAETPEGSRMAWLPGTYELCGPAVNKNPEGYDRMRLVMHDAAERPLDAAGGALLPVGSPRSYDDIKDAVLALSDRGWEGIVFHGGPEGAMAKIKARDFGAKAATPAERA